MMRRVLSILALAAAGCSDDAVVVTLEARPAVHDAARVVVAVSDGTDRTERPFDLDGAEFPLDLVVATEGRRGELEVTVEALDERGLLVGVGAGATPLGGDRELTVTLEPADFLVNTTVLDGQFLSEQPEGAGRQLAGDPDGGFLAAWQDQDTRTVFARLFDGEARAVENARELTDREFQVPAYAENDGPVALAHAGDRYAVLWEQHLAGETHARLMLSIHDDGDAAAVSSGETTAAWADDSSQRAPALAAAGGGFVAAWVRTADRFEFEGELRARWFDPHGAAGGGDLAPCADALPLSGAPDIADLGDGRAALAWIARDGGGWPGAYACAASPGAPGSSHAIDAGPDSMVFDVALAGDGEGGAVLAWIAAVAEGGRVGLRRLDDAGNAVGEEVVVAEVEQAETVAIARRADGGYLVVWDDGDDTPDGDIHARAYRADLSPVGEPFVVPTTRAGLQRAPSVVASGNTFVVAWTDGSGAEPDPSYEAVRARVVYLP